MLESKLMEKVRVIFSRPEDIRSWPKHQHDTMILAKHSAESERARNTNQKFEYVWEVNLRDFCSLGASELTFRWANHRGSSAMFSLYATKNLLK